MLTKLFNSKRRTLALAIAAAMVLPGAALAQGSKGPVRLVVPYAAGGLPDTVARMLAQRLTETTGNSHIVDNRPGGNGAVAAANLATSPTDGDTLLVTDGSMLTINPLTNKKLPYDPVNGFVPVSLVATSPLFLAINSSVKANTLEEFIALAKSKPGQLNIGSSGIGSSHHLTAEAMKAGLGIFMTHIPYRGSGASVPALVGNQVDAVFSAYPSLAAFAKNGQVKILATNSLKRSSLAPNVPALSEKIPNFDFAVQVVVLAPKGTPNEAVQRISAEIAKLAKRQDVIDNMKVAGIEMVGGGPAQAAQSLDAERKRMAAAAKAANLQPE
ncbi:MAG: Tripartite-type tricarboxylate transporter, receptor component TctC [Noviherbaspirillum sp.]|nr:Tripartite-type tricarboxylate transporter, receptor component TctC [Noviherbaspirillum sp.]